MSRLELFQIVVYFVLLIACVPLLGRYMAKVFMGEHTWPSLVLQPVERGVYRLAGVQADQQQNWRQYALALITFNGLGFVVRVCLSWGSVNPVKIRSMAFPA